MNRSLSCRLALVCAVLLTLCCFNVASAQFGGIGNAAKKVLNKTDVASALAGKAPITTSLPDAIWGAPDKDSFTPREAARSLTALQRTANGGFILQPGYYRMQDQSYCLHAGTYGPGGGDGYLYAPPKGSAEDAVISVVRNSVQHPEIDQHIVQELLWAIVARAKFEDLSTELKLAASRLLTQRQLAMLNRSGLDMIPGPAMDKAIGSAPAPLRQAMQAEAQMRQMFNSGSATYADLERIAVLGGSAPRGEGSQGVPSGRWSLHPDGYYIRYIPSSYSSTRVEIWVPQGSPTAGKEYDPATHIAVPGNTSRQRLIQSGRIRQEM